MKKRTEYGSVEVLDRGALFSRLAEIIELAASGCAEQGVGLTGGSTPKAWYAWAVESGALSGDSLDRIIWSVSDERRVPLGSEESNFGNASRLLLDPLSIPGRNRSPWPVDLDPEAAAEQFSREWSARFGEGKAFDLCVLGMGDDCHTASIFPGSPLIGSRDERLFTALDVPGKGWRLTITPRGLACCGRIVVIVTGSGKAAALERVFRSEYNPAEAPVQLLREASGRVLWLVDPDAAADAFG